MKQFISYKTVQNDFSPVWASRTRGAVPVVVSHYFLS